MCITEKFNSIVRGTITEISARYITEILATKLNNYSNFCCLQFQIYLLLHHILVYRCDTSLYEHHRKRYRFSQGPPNPIYVPLPLGREEFYQKIIHFNSELRECTFVFFCVNKC